jgi:hypothetical protein
MQVKNVSNVRRGGMEAETIQSFMIRQSLLTETSFLFLRSVGRTYPKISLHERLKALACINNRAICKCYKQ